MGRFRSVAVGFLVLVGPALGDTLRVPQQHRTIQAAIDQAQPGDTILVAPGRYAERLRLKPGVVLRSAGEDTRGKEGLQRAEATVLDGGGKAGKQPGVAMAEGATLDGFTVTNVGAYDEALWQKHHASQGEELGDDEGAVHAEGTVPAIGIQGVSCTVTHCVVHHNGDVGIGILGKEGTRTAPRIVGNVVYRNLGGGIGVAEGAVPLVQGNTCKENLRAGIGCRQANPIVTDNVCSHNLRAGIGCREGSQPILRGNRCFRNRRAGIGMRMEGTAPVVEGNDCSENDMAGIGCRDGARPLLRHNVCRGNKMAGIGVQSKATALLVGNRCLDNQLVAVGVAEGATAILSDNELARTGGQPPLVAVRDGSTATLRANRLTGGGVATVLVQGQATLLGNTFTGAGKGQGVWVREGSSATIADNVFTGYRTAVQATGAAVVITGNTIRQLQGTAIVVKNSPRPAHVFGNTAESAEPTARVVDVQGPAGVVADNTLKMAKP